MTKQELFEALKDVPDDTEIMIYDYVNSHSDIESITTIEKIQISWPDPTWLGIKKYCAENEYFDAVVLS